MSLDRDGSPSLPQAEKELLTALWSQALGDDQPISRDRLRLIARRVGRAAQEGGLLAEELIVAVKDTCAPPHEVRDPSDRHRLRWVMTETISLCIDEFYLALRDADSRRALPESRRRAGSDSSRIRP